LLLLVPGKAPRRVNYQSASSKATAVRRMYALAGQEAEPLGPGSKEKKSALVALGRAVGLDLGNTAGKIECGRQIAAQVGVRWADDCYSRGDTVTLTGLNRLVEGAVTFLGADLDPALIAEMGGGSESTSRANDKRGANLTMVDMSEVEQNIAEALANLSRPGPTPTEVEPSPDEFSAAEISYSNGTWRAHLARVQGWLRLENLLDETSPDMFFRTLATGLGEPATAGESVVLPRLEERLERALELRQFFDDLLESEAEGGATRESATQAWLAAWEEVEEEEDSEGSGPIKAAADTWAIAEFVGYSEDGELILSPSYQRADVWPTTTAQQLIESILRGIPLPSVILLQRTNEHRVTYEVVDGKQRLTSVLRFIGMHPRALALVKEKSEAWGVPELVELFKADYPKFKKLWKTHEAESLTGARERDYYFPFPLRSGDAKPLAGEDLAPLKGRYFCQIRNETINVVGEPRQVGSLFNKTNSKYRVPVIVYETVTSDQIHEVFSLYNKQGKHLNAEEIRNALYHHLDLMRGLLVTAGDSEDVENVAPFLVPAWPELSSTPEVLDSYGFGKAGYKRTKLLSWVAAAMLFSDGRAPYRSTASQVNALLKRVDDDGNDPLRSQQRVRELMLLLDRALDVHAEIPDEVWDPTFKNAQEKAKWQELQLVSTLIGFAAAAAALEDQFDSRVEEALTTINMRSGGWKRPEKTQTKEQWKFIAGVVAALLNILDVPPAVAHAATENRFGSSGLQGLLTLAPVADDRA
jgi:hypothetical protein